MTATIPPTSDNSTYVNLTATIAGIETVLIPISPAKPSAYVEIAPGGDCIRLCMPTGPIGKTNRPPRGNISGFTRGSRSRALRLLKSLDKTQIDITRVFFTSNTYAGEGHPIPTPRQAKQDLRAFCKRIDRAFGPSTVIWKLEPQKRGAPHFHLLVILPPGADARAFGDWARRNWHEMVGDGQEAHLMHGIDVQPMKDWKQVTNYLCKYIGKVIDKYNDDGMANRPDWNWPGRWWGKHNIDLVPHRRQRQDISRRTAVILARALRGWYSSQTTTRWWSPQLAKTLTKQQVAEIRGELSKAARIHRKLASRRHWTADLAATWNYATMRRLELAPILNDLKPTAWRLTPPKGGGICAFLNSKDGQRLIDYATRRATDRYDRRPDMTQYQGAGRPATARAAVGPPTPSQATS